VAIFFTKQMTPRERSTLFSASSAILIAPQFFGGNMATYKDLLAQKAKLEEQLESARVAELEAVIAQTRQIVLEYGLTAEDIGLTSKSKKKASKKTVAAKYMDPKTGVTWSGRGRAPAWIEGKNRDRFLIK